ncbi:hypothetical protein [Adhaeretor mobilis]|uniref:Uncharacterized protein n=1 Tax=Adhaeretor mobilis TaxID=1930276 RepID=A0A517MQE5_9BACT|nr:hypothetical protein [Adhaeretor mobilis]QDS97092.1 hypothetical protein HG15A2_03520 [Adhaeretor mobilis]
MNRIKLQSATAIALSLLYLAIGLAGESLHYFVESALVESGSSVSTGTAAEVLAGEASSGFYHFHGPDFHVHYHGPVKVAGSETSTATKKQQKESGATFQESGQQHQPHACPLLAVLATLKLGQGGLASWSLEVTACHRVHGNAHELAARGFSQCYLARGPPSLRIV